jgi:hypothetical protein
LNTNYTKYLNTYSEYILKVFLTRLFITNIFILFSQCNQCSSNKNKIKELEAEIKVLQEEVSNKQQLFDSIQSFVSDEQLKSFENPIRKWSKDTIVKALKLRYALGIHGYNYL